MPTKAQYEKLIDNTTNEWTTINGVNGRKFINKSDSNKYIFLPAGGDWDATGHSNAGSYGFYLSTTIYTVSYAYHMRFSSNGITWLKSYSKGHGNSVRAIQLTYIYTCSRTSE